MDVAKKIGTALLLAIIISTIFFILVFAGEGIKNRIVNTANNKKDVHGFINVENGETKYTNYSIVYDYETRVMYIIEYRGGISPLYNADGTLRVYKE